MSPNSRAPIEEKVMTPNKKEAKEFETEIVYRNVFLLSLLHLGALYSFYLIFTSADIKTFIFASLCAVFAGLGVTAGAHRLWCHRSYSAKLPLRILLCVGNCMAAQNDIYEWSRDHRVHHKFTETDADPHNMKRGFFFAHVGWLLCRKHPQVKERGKTVDLEDLWSDPVVRFQRRFYKPLVVLFCYCLPIMIPVWGWNESVWNSIFITLLRYCVTIQGTLLVNSAAHIYGDKPYDKNIEATENPLVSLFALGEGWHNYHHAFPWDYSTSELGYKLNLTKIFIDFMAWIGQAYDLKTAQPHVVKRKKLQSGDGTRQESGDALKSF